MGFVEESVYCLLQMFEFHQTVMTALESNARSDQEKIEIRQFGGKILKC